MSQQSTPSPPKKAAPTTTVLDVIKKSYNNVKWKGCILKVEPAKLHFLDRLRVEREGEEALASSSALRDSPITSSLLCSKGEGGGATSVASNIVLCDDDSDSDGETTAGSSTANTNPTTTATTSTVDGGSLPPPIPPTTTPPTNRIRRHLRIRKQHGQEAYMVDTKPLVNINYKDLHFTLRKQRTKYKKHSDALIQGVTKTKDMLGRENSNRPRSEGERVYAREKMEDAIGNLSLHSKVFLNRSNYDNVVLVCYLICMLILIQILSSIVLAYQYGIIVLVC